MWWFGKFVPFPLFGFIGLLLALLAQAATLVVVGSLWALVPAAIFFGTGVIFFLPAINATIVIRGTNNEVVWLRVIPYALFWQGVVLFLFGIMMLLTGNLRAEFNSSFLGLVVSILIVVVWIFSAALT